MSTSTLRPNATSTAFGSVTGAANEHSAMSDDSDSSYAQGTNGAWQFGTVAMGTGAVTKQARLRIRGRSNSGTVPGVLNGAWPVGGGENGPTCNVTMTTSLTNHVGAYKPVTWSQAQVNAAILDTAAPSAIRIYEAYIDLVYVTQPSTNVDTVTDPTTDRTAIPISWVNTLDADGGPQTRYELKVFTDAQYGAGGFSPATSTPFYTSGIVASAAVTADTGLLPNDTYRAYVRVAQTVNGALHWSAWDFDQFTVNVDSPEIDTVVGTPSDATGSISVAVTRDSGGEAWGFIEIERSLDAGATWSPVRGATYVPTVDANTHTVVDYEVPNGAAVTYRARATRVVSDLPLTGEWVESSSVDWESDVMWLKVPGQPSLNMTVRLAVLADEILDVRRGVFPVIGAERPIVISDVRQDPVGALHVFMATPADVEDLRALLRQPVILVHTPSAWRLGIDYISPGIVRRVRGPKVFTSSEVWSIEYVSVDAPGDPDAGAP